MVGLCVVMRENNMRLTASRSLTREMKIEINTILERLQDLNNLNPDHLAPEAENQIIQELNAYKAKIERFFSQIDIKEEKVNLISRLLVVETACQKFQKNRFSSDDPYCEILTDWTPQKLTLSDEYDRYTQMGLEIAPDNSDFNFQHGTYLRNLQDEFFEETSPATEWDYSFLEYFKKAYEYEEDPQTKQNHLVHLRKDEARRDYYNGYIKEIQNLEQFGTPNTALEEAKCEIYKVTITANFQCCKAYTGECRKYMSKSKCMDDYCNHRVQFQNEAGDINMGICYNDPILDVYDIHWFSVLELEMETSILKKEGLIMQDEEFETLSCFVELHRNRGSKLLKKLYRYVNLLLNEWY